MNVSQAILIRNGLVAVPEEKEAEHIDEAQLATLISNLTFYGFSLNEDGLSALNCLSLKSATVWWDEVRVILEAITGADKRMGDHVVYRNFPSEVLSMDEASYWGRQILMYWGFDKSLFAEPAKPREMKTEKIRLRVLQIDDGQGLERIQAGLMALPARWTEQQLADAQYLAPKFAHLADLSGVKFKENMVGLAKELIKAGIPFKSKSATDVLRLGIGLSGGDVSMRTSSKFMKFPNRFRKFLTLALRECTDVKADMARDVERWKRFVRAIHPGDHTQHGDALLGAVDALYKGTLPPTFDSIVESKLLKNDKSVLEDLKFRPGDFVRRLRVCIEKFNMDAAVAFCETVPKLTTIQMLKLEGVLTTFNDRSQRMYAPKGQWSKVKLSTDVDPESDKRPKLPIETILAITEKMGEEIRGRLDKVVGSVSLDERTKLVKIQGNDSELSSYGRGTRFILPTDVRFVRVASYWAAPGLGTVWYDNGVNFFDASWKSTATICWNNATIMGDGAAFSGDPLSSKDKEGRACQIIDLYLDKLKARGIRYCVWNLLCYSQKSFDEAEVFAALQWGVEPTKGELFDPARVQLSFPVKGKTHTKYIAYLDLENRELTYMDANLPGNVSAASGNEATLQKLMPPFVEYLGTLPSVHDLFKHQKRDSTGGTPILYEDSQTRIESKRAYVFNQVNKDNGFQQLNLGELL